MISIRKNLMMLLVGTFIVVGGASVIYTWYNTEQEIEGVFDELLVQEAHFLINMTLHEISERDLHDFHTDILGTDTVYKHQKWQIYQVWREDSLILRSNNSPLYLLSTEHGYSTVHLDGISWRILMWQDPDSGLMAIVGEESSFRDTFVGTIVLQVFWPLLISIPVLAVLIVISVRRGLLPLVKITDEVKHRSSNQLDTISMELVPQEVSSLVDEFNRLMVRLQKSLETERSFTSDAAHELRTPLAALKVQVQLAQRVDDDARKGLLSKMIEGVNQLSRLVDDLLILAKIESRAVQPGDIVKINLVILAKDVMAQLTPTALERQIDLDMVSKGVANIYGIPILLKSLISNLIENALNYTPEGGKVNVTIKSKSETVVLNVSDTGSGIPKELRDRVVDRFYRISGEQQSGSGLGLSIVSRIVEVHEGIMSIGDSEMSGASITVTLPIKVGYDDTITNS